MNPNTTVILSLIALVFSIFGSAWLNLRQIERLLDSFRGEMKADLNSMRSELRAEIQVVNQKMDQGQVAVNQLVSRIERVERQLDKVFDLKLK